MKKILLPLLLFTVYSRCIAQSVSVLAPVSADTAFRVLNNGTGPVGAFITKNSDNTGALIYGDHFGKGTGLRMRLMNAQNNNAGLHISQFGNGSAILSQSNKSKAGEFYANAGNADTAVYIKHDGTGMGMNIQLTNFQNQQPGIKVINENAASGSIGIYSYNGSSGLNVLSQKAILGESDNGIGLVGLSNTGNGILGMSSAAHGIQGITYAKGKAGVTGVSGVDSSFGVWGYNDLAGGSGIIGSSNLNGNAGRFIITHPLNTNHAMEIINFGKGNGIRLKMDNAQNLREGIYVDALNTSSSAIGIYAQKGASNILYSFSTAIRGENSIGDGLSGLSNSGTGVYGRSLNGNGVYGGSSQGIGVSGETSSAANPAIKAAYTGNGQGTALEINNGALKASGQNPFVFLHIANPQNNFGYVTVIDNPICNNDPNCALFIQPIYLGPAPYFNLPVMVQFDPISQKWEIYISTTNGGPHIPDGQRFYVMLIKR